jgi:tryptophan 2,3-dioxygenase
VLVFAQFTDVFTAYVEKNRREVVAAIADFSMDVPLSRLIQLTKIYCHEFGYWKSRLREICVPGEIPDYPTFVGSSKISEAVLDRGLKGDTFFVQFRGVHQVPEILTAEINDHLECAILAIRQENLRQAYLHLRSVNILLLVVVESIHPIADNLTPADYHKFRENLGVTSGSHSVNLHYHLFRDLYGQVGTTFLEHLKHSGQQHFAEEDPLQSLRLIDERILTDHQHFATHLIANELLTLRAGIERWRHSHLQLPRNAVGGGRTKSLTGSPDVIESVKRMRDRAQAADVLQSLAEARFLQGTSSGRTTEHRRDPHSEDVDREKLPLDEMLMDLTGDVTKARFEDVQKRAGHFSDRASFTAPAKRIV